MNKPTVKEHTVTDSSGSRPAIAPLNPKQAALVLIALFVALSGYVAIGIQLGLTALFAGSLLLFFWAGIEHFKLNALLPTLLGSLGGISNGALFAILAPSLGEALAVVAGVLVLLGAIYCLLLNWLPHIFNQAYMLMLTISLAPPIMTEGSFVAMGVAAVYSAAFWGGLMLLISSVRSRRAVTGPD